MCTLLVHASGPKGRRIRHRLGAEHDKGLFVQSGQTMSIYVTVGMLTAKSGPRAGSYSGLYVMPLGKDTCLAEKANA
jgi:hypothetical protein